MISPCLASFNQFRQVPGPEEGTNLLSLLDRRMFQNWPASVNKCPRVDRDRNIITITGNGKDEINGSSGCSRNLSRLTTSRASIKCESRELSYDPCSRRDRRGRRSTLTLGQLFTDIARQWFVRIGEWQEKFSNIPRGTTSRVRKKVSQLVLCRLSR